VPGDGSFVLVDPLLDALTQGLWETMAGEIGV
jgi:hypothetical protein